MSPQKEACSPRARIFERPDFMRNFFDRLEALIPSDCVCAIERPGVDCPSAARMRDGLARETPFYAASYRSGEQLPGAVDSASGKFCRDARPTRLSTRCRPGLLHERLNTLNAVPGRSKCSQNSDASRNASRQGIPLHIALLLSALPAPEFLQTCSATGCCAQRRFDNPAQF